MLRTLLCTAVLLAAAPPARGAANPEDVRLAIRRGIDFLIARQERDGCWGSPRNTKNLNIYAPVPGAHDAFRTGTTALCLAALIESADDRPAVRDAIARGGSWMRAQLPKLRRATADTTYNVWGHAYAIQALVRLRARTRDAEEQAAYQALIASQIDYLARYECIYGGWAYYDFEARTQRPSDASPSFVTATVLVALKEAADAGIRVPPELVARGMQSILRQRKPDSSYLYAESHKWRPMRLVNRPAGSLGRSQACNVALRLWGGAVTDEVLRTWLERLFARNGWLSIGRKRPIPHEAWFQVAGYFFYYGHYYAALCMDALDPSVAAPYRDRMAALLVGLQEKDGSWWDYPLYDYHQQYGTAFALLTLLRCTRVEL